MQRTITVSIAVWLAAWILSGCGGAQHQSAEAVSGAGLKLTRAVLYQNGVGYFERRGTVDGDRITLRIRSDQVNDLLKSLTVIDASEGKAVSVSLPLDRNAARQVMELADRLKDGIGLPDLIDMLMGSEVTMRGDAGSITGRVLSLDELGDSESDVVSDWRVTVLGGDAVHTIMLSDVQTIYVQDQFIVLGLHKGLDAAATGGVFKVVDVTVHLDRDGEHDLLVSYVVECPAWKPSYRLVVGDGGEVLLQGWAVVDNVTGEKWDGIDLSLTSGAPLAFRYDLYAPRFVGRPDLTHVAGRKVAQAAVGETSYDEAAEMEAPEEDVEEAAFKRKSRRISRKMKKESAPSKPRPMPAPSVSSMGPMGGAASSGAFAKDDRAELSLQSLQESARAMVQATAASGTVRYDMLEPVSIPDRSSTLVSILNNQVPGEETFLFKPGGAGQGYEQNPYRVVRFENTTGFILEPGPISIYSGGAFVGEGIGESISDGGKATIPFAVDASILVMSTSRSANEGARLIKVTRGVVTVESFSRKKTTYTVKGGDGGGYRLYVRHTKAGSSYKLKDKLADTEDVGDAFLIPIDVKKGAEETKYTVVEQTPVRRSLTIWDGKATTALELFLKNVEDIPKQTRDKLKEILDKRARVGTIDTKLYHLRKKQEELDERMRQTRENLKALKKNKAAGALKGRLAKKLEEYSKETDAVARQIVELTNERMELKVALEEVLSDLTLSG
ncbi:MAG: DUF4139 domain-containing protein [Deltaproteobacteria bacterium]|nr:DUF4139 domain-containing protein [Deltaproteobacteria bacterium]